MKKLPHERGKMTPCHVKKLMNVVRTHVQKYTKVRPASYGNLFTRTENADGRSR